MKAQNSMNNNDDLDQDLDIGFSRRNLRRNNTIKESIDNNDSSRPSNSNIM